MSMTDIRTVNREGMLLDFIAENLEEIGVIKRCQLAKLINEYGKDQYNAGFLVGGRRYWSNDPH